MIIIAHRAQDVAAAIPHRFGVEVDVRDRHSAVVVSHDLPVGRQTTLEAWLRRDIERGGVRPIYAINIKCDGIERDVSDVLGRLDLWGRAFVFDGTYPTMRRFRELGVQTAWRCSDEEVNAAATSQTVRLVWWDHWSYQGPWQTLPALAHVFAVSPELHCSDVPMDTLQDRWRELICAGVAGICTDWWYDLETYLKEVPDVDPTA